jgi:hypothetical protein
MKSQGRWHHVPSRMWSLDTSSERSWQVTKPRLDRAGSSRKGTAVGRRLLRIWSMTR